jgi:hypothetical protein
MNNINPLDVPIGPCVDLLRCGVILGFGSYQIRPSGQNLDTYVDMCLDMWDGESWCIQDSRRITIDNFLLMAQDINEHRKG